MDVSLTMDSTAFSATYRQLLILGSAGGAIDDSNLKQLMIHNIASLILSAIFLMASPIRLYQLRKCVNKNANGTNGRTIKLVGTQDSSLEVETH